MKKVLFVLLFTIVSANIYAQIDLSASMGLDFRSASNFKDYINFSFPQSGNQVSSFKSAVAFNFEVDYKISSTFALGIEHNILIDSYNASFGTLGVYNIEYTIQRPSILAYYIIPGEGYQFKLGGGVGFRFVSLTEQIITTTKYSSSGFGLLLKAEGNTLLAKDFYALIGANVRYDKTGNVSNGDQYIINSSNGEKLNLDAISFGIYLGVTYTF